MFQDQSKATFVVSRYAMFYDLSRVNCVDFRAGICFSRLASNNKVVAISEQDSLFLLTIAVTAPCHRPL